MSMILFLSISLQIVSGILQISSEACIYIDYIGKDVKELNCSQSSVCRKSFKVSNVFFPPFNAGEDETRDRSWIGTIFDRCCGSCTEYETIHNFENITTVTPSLLNSSDFIYPFLGTMTTSKLHGFHFLPYKEAPETLYITKTNHDIVLKSIFKLYPLIIVCLLLAAVAGFIAWIIETWSNKEQFPRPFLIGWFEGFWWSFISMTTVGYGDKCPKSIPSRLFAVVWILIGIIACGIITGKLTGEVINANSPPPASMKGARVGVLNHREYDAFVVAQNGGRVESNKNISNFYVDVVELISKLHQGKIDGFLMDRETLMEVTHEIRNDENENENILEKLNFFLYETTRNEITSKYHPHFVYGILVKHYEDYEYFKHFVDTLRNQNMILDAIEWNVFVNDVKEDGYARIYDSSYSLLFSPSEYFRKSIIAISIMIGLILLFGIVYEGNRKKYKFECC